MPGRRRLVAVDPTTDAVETTASIVWSDDGIVHIQSKDTPSTTETTTELVAAVRDTIDGVPLPGLFDLRKWRKGSPEGWEILISKAMSLFTAVAFLVDPKSSPRMGVFPEAINRLLMSWCLPTGTAVQLSRDTFSRSRDRKGVDYVIAI